MRDELRILPLRVEDVALEVEGRVLLEDLSFVLEGTERTVILGPNGAGKSLTLRLCHGLARPSRGRLEWLGPAAASAVRRHAMVFQRPVMLRRTALANLTHSLALAGVAHRARRRAALAALERFGLAALAEHPARLLSGGEQQRLALARAWLSRPQVIFLDEPTANLDPASTRAVELLVQGFRQEGIKVVMTTHDLAQARRLADEVLFLHRGRLLEQAPAAQFFCRPATPEAQAFLAGELYW
jgi:tungstate transport system ATP-binding protein